MIPAVLPVYDRYDINISHAKGQYLYSLEGGKYLDMFAGYAALAFGHCHPKLVEALTDQAHKLWHISNRFKIPGLFEYSQRLVDNSFADTVFIANTGAEAVEGIIKMARRYFNAQDQRHRFRILTFEGAFHGRTLAAATAGSKEKIEGFEPAVAGFDRVAWNDINAFKAAITDHTAGVLIEPIQGEGGMRPASPDFLREVARICREKGMLLLLDEVQCGMGRTGHLFAYEYYGIKPDLVALAKGLGAGFPISACLATESVGKHMKYDSHGSTYGGNPLAIAVATTVLNLMSEKGFLEHVQTVGEYFKTQLEQLKMQFPNIIEEITGTGLMLGIRLKPKFTARQVAKSCLDHFMLSIYAGNNVLRVTPALNIEKEHCDEAIDKFTRVFQELKD